MGWSAVGTAARLICSPQDETSYLSQMHLIFFSSLYGVYHILYSVLTTYQRTLLGIIRTVHSGCSCWLPTNTVSEYWRDIIIQNTNTTSLTSHKLTQPNLSWLDARLLMYDEGPDDSFWASNSKRSTDEFARDGAVGGDTDKSLRWLLDARSSPIWALGWLNSTHDSSNHKPLPN